MLLERRRTQGVERHKLVQSCPPAGGLPALPAAGLAGGHPPATWLL